MKIKFLLLMIISINILTDEITDPFENTNRNIHAFNDRLDTNLLKPLASTYRKITPQFARTGVTNFFENLEEIDTTINQVLQGNIKLAFNDATRFFVNSTIGRIISPNLVLILFISSLQMIGLGFLGIQNNILKKELFKIQRQIKKLN